MYFLTVLRVQREIKVGKAIPSEGCEEEQTPWGSLLVSGGSLSIFRSWAEESEPCFLVLLSFFEQLESSRSHLEVLVHAELIPYTVQEK